MRTLLAALAPMLLVPSAFAAPKKGGPADQFHPGPVGKAPPACGAKLFPLVEGNSWTYGQVAALTAPREDLARLTPVAPQKIVITVKKVEQQGKGADEVTVATLEEKVTTEITKDPKKPVIDERTVTSTITCNKTKFEVSPESFFFSGEPGGAFGVVFDDFKRTKDTTFKFVNGTIGEGEWREDIVAHFTRTPTPSSGVKLDSGKLELERKFTPGNPERINTKLGVYKAEHLGVLITGRVTLDHPVGPDAKPMELPANWLNQIWLAEGVGVIQTLDQYAHEYQLVDATLK